MKTSKASPLSVSFRVPDLVVTIRKAELIDEKGYAYIRYSGDSEPEEFNKEAFTELLKLIPPIKYIEKNGKRLVGEYELPDIDPNKVIRFINRFGVIGISDLGYRNSALEKSSPRALAGFLNMNLDKSVKPLYKDKQLDPKFRRHLLEIRNGNEFPYWHILGLLRNLARSARLYNNLHNDPNFTSERLELNDKNRKRIVSAWYSYGGAFLDSEDPADKKFFNNPEWLFRYNKGKHSSLDFAEGALSSFAELMNFHLRPISGSVIDTDSTREFKRQNSGFETAFSGYLVNSFYDQRTKRICLVCRKPFLPERVKEENKYCGEFCAKVIRNQRYRAKQKKVSASKAGSKKTTKGKEKNEQTQNGRAKGRNR